MNAYSQSCCVRCDLMALTLMHVNVPNFSSGWSISDLVGRIYVRAANPSWFCRRLLIFRENKPIWIHKFDNLPDSGNILSIELYVIFKNLPDWWIESSWLHDVNVGSSDLCACVHSRQDWLRTKQYQRVHEFIFINKY